jgi:hypothetical protein
MQVQEIGSRFPGRGTAATALECVQHRHTDKCLSGSRSAASRIRHSWHIAAAVISLFPSEDFLPPEACVLAPNACELQTLYAVVHSALVPVNAV